MAASPIQGKTVGKYKLGDVLGEGSFGKVHLATHIETNGEYAIKCIAKESLSKQEHGKEQLYREIAIMKSLKHPHVVTLYEVLQTKNNIYLVLELIDGCALLKKIPDGVGVEESKARNLFQQLITAMHYCHQQQVAHRDLKPENLLLTRGGELKVSDFGLSNLQFVDEGGQVSSSLKLRTVCGTPNYVAPEVFNTQNGYDGFKADLWSCGVILYQLLSGYLPFRAKQVSEVLSKIRNLPPQADKSISPEAQDLIDVLLVKNPEERATIPDVLKHAWFKVGFDETTISEKKKSDPEEET